VQPVVDRTICLKYLGGPLNERRRAKRFQVDWQVRVEGTGDAKDGFIEAGVLRNISSSGALLFLKQPLSTGAKLDIYVMLPLQGKKWMKYPAHVVRVERGIAAVGAAVKFESARPDFPTTLGPV
jgi:PilZ domain-containing protein